MGWVSHLEHFWKEPHFALFLTRLARFSRVILFDKRGTGLSDYAKRIRGDDYPWGPTREEHRAWLLQMANEGGGPVGIDVRAPSLAFYESFRDWWTTYLRMGHPHSPRPGRRRRLPLHFAPGTSAARSIRRIARLRPAPLIPLAGTPTRLGTAYGAHVRIVLKCGSSSLNSRNRAA